MNEQEMNLYEHLWKFFQRIDDEGHGTDNQDGPFDEPSNWVLDGYLLVLVESLLQLQRFLLHKATEWSALPFSGKDLQEFQLSDDLATCAGLQTRPLPWDSWGSATETSGDPESRMSSDGKTDWRISETSVSIEQPLESGNRRGSALCCF